MNPIERMVAIGLLLVVLPACSQAQNSAPAPAKPATAVVDAEMEPPKESAVMALVGSATLDFPGDGTDAPVSVADRIFDGFQAGPGHLRLDDGSVIHWGFKHEEANLQSVAINDAQGRLRLLAAVNNSGRLTSSYAAPIVTIEQYEKSRGAAMLEEASVSLFIGDTADLTRYLPIIKRWLQADLLGFNADCNDAALKQACELATKITPSLSAYVASKDDQTALSPVAVPDLMAAPVPLEQFVQ